MQTLPLRTPHNGALGSFHAMLCLIFFVGCTPINTDITIDETPAIIQSKTAPTTTSINKSPKITTFIQSAVDAHIHEPLTTNNPGQTPEDGSLVLMTGKSLNAVGVNTSKSPRNDGIHDTSNDAIVVLQDPAVAMKDFPRDRRQQIDWVQTLEQGLIEPRADLLGKTEMSALDLDIVMKNTQFMPWVKFPHLKHTKWLACSNCHPAIFEAKEHANPITMNKVLRGEFCGVCHDKVAFALFTCERCHSVPHEGSGPKWW